MRTSLLSVCFLAAISTAPALAAQEFPMAFTGIWAEADCNAPTRVKMINRLGIIDFIRIGDSLSVQISAFESLAYDAGAGILKAQVVVPSIDGTLPVEISLAGLYLNETFVSCETPPKELLWTFGEVIPFLEAIGATAEECARSSDAQCLLPMFEYVDVTGDKQLSVAEISRLFRAGGFLLGYIARNQGLVPAQELVGFVALGGLLSPMFVRNLVDGMDYNQDGLLSLDELLQDRGDAAGFAALGTALGPAAAQTTVKAALAALPSALTAIFGFVR